MFGAQLLVNIILSFDHLNHLTLSFTFLDTEAFAGMEFLGWFAFGFFC